MAINSNNNRLVIIFSLVVALLGCAEVQSVSVSQQKVKVILNNKCDFPLWPGVYPGLDTLSEALMPKLQMNPDQTKTLNIRPWQSDIYVWPRTQCNLTSPTKTCLTGDCGSGYGFKCFFGRVEGPPVTTALFRKMSYSVDMLSGFNVPISVQPIAQKEKSDDDGEEECRVMGCAKAVDEWCPEEMQVRNNKQTVACTPIDGDSQSEEDYDTLLKKNCPCTHPIAGPHSVSEGDYLEGYLLTFCPA